MAYRAFLDPNKPCFLQQLYLLQFKHLHFKRSLFDLDIDTGIRDIGIGFKTLLFLLMFKVTLYLSKSF